MSNTTPSKPKDIKTLLELLLEEYDKAIIVYPMDCNGLCSIALFIENTHLLIDYLDANLPYNGLAYRWSTNEAGHKLRRAWLVEQIEKH